MPIRNLRSFAGLPPLEKARSAFEKALAKHEERAGRLPALEEAQRSAQAARDAAQERVYAAERATDAHDEKSEELKEAHEDSEEPSEKAQLAAELAAHQAKSSEIIAEQKGAEKGLRQADKQLDRADNKLNAHDSGVDRLFSKSEEIVETLEGHISELEDDDGNAPTDPVRAGLHAELSRGRDELVAEMDHHLQGGEAMAEGPRGGHFYISVTGRRVYVGQEHT